MVLDNVLDIENTGIGFDFAAASRTYRARYNADNITAVTQAVVDSLGIDQDRFVGTNSSFIRAPYPLFVPTSNTFTGTKYVGVVTWSNNNGTSSTDAGSQYTQRRLLFGARTVTSDLPTTGMATLKGSATVDDVNGVGGSGETSLSIDFAAKTVTATTAYRPTPSGGAGSSFQDPIPIVFSGVLDPTTARINGTVNYAANSATGTFEGALYGPRGAEGAILFKILFANGNLIFGVLVCGS